MKRALIQVLAWGFVTLSSPAYAHRPTMSDGTAVDADHAIEFQDVQISRVVYHDVTKQAPRVWITFKVDQPQELFLQIGVPVLDRLRKYRPALALLGPGLPDVLLPFGFPSGVGGLILDTRSIEKPREFYEPFTGTSSWILKEHDVQLPTTGRYYVVAYDPDEKPGKLWAALGRKEVWNTEDMLRMPKIITEVRQFHEVAAVSDAGSKSDDRRVIYDFDARDSSGEWFSVNDDVMGGISEGGVRITDRGVLEFKGVVSLENNGGFASIRSRPDKHDLSEFEGILVRVRGDGQRYACNIRTDFAIIAGSYQERFETKKDEWQEIALNFRDFVATSFGQVMRDAAKLDTEKIRSFGFTISDKQAGPFRLEVDWIKAVKTREDAARTAGPAEQDTAQVVAGLIQKAIGRGAPLFNAGQPEACAGIYEIAARCIIDLAAADLPAEVVETLRAGLAKANQTTDPAAGAWALRDAFDVSLRMLGR